MAAVCQRFDLIEHSLKLLLGRFRDGRYLVGRRSDVDRTKFPAFLSGNSPSNFGKLPLGLRSSQSFTWMMIPPSGPRELWRQDESLRESRAQRHVAGLRRTLARALRRPAAASSVHCFARVLPLMSWHLPPTVLAENRRSLPPPADSRAKRSPLKSLRVRWRSRQLFASTTPSSCYPTDASAECL